MIGMMADLPVRERPEMTFIRPRSNETVRILCCGFFGHRMILLIWKSTKRSPALVSRCHTTLGPRTMHQAFPRCLAMAEQSEVLRSRRGCPITTLGFRKQYRER